MSIPGVEYVPGTSCKSEHKVWGNVTHCRVNNNLLNSQLFVLKGSECSIHKHAYRYNSFYSQSAHLRVTVWADSDDVRDLAGLANKTSMDWIIGPGDYLTIPPGLYHMFVVETGGIVSEFYWADDPTNLRFDDIYRLNVGSTIKI